MKRMFFCMALAMAVFFAASSVQARGGPVYNKLKDSFCKSQSPFQKRVGCDGYFQLRIIHDNKRDKAKSNCHWNCNRIYRSDPTKANNCKAGCNYSHGIDK